MSHSTKISTPMYWPSPVYPSHVSYKSFSFGDIQFFNDTIYWTQSVPSQKGRMALVHCKVNCFDVTEVLPEQFNVVSYAYGYGGGAFHISKNKLFFYDLISQAIYLKNLNDEQIQEVFSHKDCSFSNFVYSEKNQCLFALMKREEKDRKFPLSEIVKISLHDHTLATVCTGYDFYSDLTLNPSETKIAWLQWNFPNMPWGSNELLIADINTKGEFTNKHKVEKTKKISFYQPSWFSDEKLFVCSDEKNNWQIFYYENNKLQSLFSFEGEIGRPAWIAGTKVYEILQDQSVVFSYCQKGVWGFAQYCLNRKSIFSFEFKDIQHVNNIASNGVGLVFLGGGSTTPLSLFHVNAKNKALKLIAPYHQEKIDTDYISSPQIIEFKTSQLENCYALFYSPKNKEYSYQINEKPPLIIKIHGGPTLQADVFLNYKIQYFTSRGFAFIDLNYRGSTGFGRIYREKLQGNWGVTDVEDVIHCVSHVVNLNLVDKYNIFITGGSAGGFTLLNVLTKTNIFNAAACYYGIADLLGMGKHIHKFEAFYDIGLLGNSADQDPLLYKERSPITHVQKIRTPVIFFHGLKDQVVDFSQSEQMYYQLKENVYCELKYYSDEGHGFKKKENIEDALIKEESFFKKFYKKTL